MITVEAVVGPEGGVRLLQSVHIQASRRALVTILDEAPIGDNLENALLSECSLSEDWNRPEEEDAWSHLQQVP